MKRTIDVPAPARILGSLVAVAAALLLTACPGGAEIENPDEVIAASRGQTGGDGDATCDPTPIFLDYCSGAPCHGGSAGNKPFGDLELIADGFEQNLVDVPASYPTGITGCPETPELLVDSSNIQESLILKKLHGTQTCGGPMPGGISLSDPDIACIEDFITALAGGSGSPGAGALLPETEEAN